MKHSGRNIVLSALMMVFACQQPQHPGDRKFEGMDNVIADAAGRIGIVENPNAITIKLRDINTDGAKIINVNDLVDSVRYVPLETTEGSIIYGGIEQVILHRGKIYILDNLGKSILMFDDGGKFLTRIGQAGNGTAEYFNPIHISIDKFHNLFHVFDDRASKVLTYDPEGNYIGERKIGFRLNDFQPLDDSTYVVNTDTKRNRHPDQITNDKLVMVNQDWQVVSSGYKYDARNCDEISFTRKGIYPFKDGYLYNPTLSYTIYEVGPHELRPKYLFDVGTMKLPDGFECGASIDEFFSKYDHGESPYIYINEAIVESDDWLITTLGYRQMPFYFFYSKKDGSVHFSAMYQNDSNDRFIALSAMQGINEKGEFYGYQDPLMLKRKMAEYRNETQKNVDESLNSLQEYDNPVFIFYKLK